MILKQLQHKNDSTLQQDAMKDKRRSLAARPKPKENSVLCFVATCRFATRYLVLHIHVCKLFGGRGEAKSTLSIADTSVQTHKLKFVPLCIL